jgi:hypothetical protein
MGKMRARDLGELPFHVSGALHSRRPLALLEVYWRHFLASS